MRSKNRIIIGVLATAGLLAATSAAAAEAFTLAGAFCNANYGAEEGVYRQDGQASVNFEHQIQLVCPLVRPNSDESGDLSLVYVRVDDHHTSQAVECRAASCNSLGTDCSVADTEASASVGMTSIHLDDMATYTNGYAYIECTVPPPQASQVSGVISYRYSD